ncbi:MAG: GHKL domain-containing protein [Lachnospiraceae bacterium]|nr:GHKL domain-containing protein [Lachnospiraceae bacterium]
MINGLITLLIIFVNVLAVLNMLLILKVFFGAAIKLNRRILFCVGGLYFAGNILFGLVKSLTNYTAVFVLVFMFVVIIKLSAEKTVGNIILVIPAALMYVQWGSMFDLAERLVGLDRFVYHYETMDVTISTILPDILLLILLLVIKAKVNEELLAIRLTKLEGVVLTIICIIYPIMVAFFNYMEGHIKHVLYKPVWLFVMILINVAVIYAVAHRKRSKYYKKLAGSYKEQFQSEYDYFKEYKENNSDVIKFRHDFNNHMLVVQEMFAKGEYDRANEYISKLSHIASGDKKIYITGNEILDMILKAKHNIMEEYNIKFNVKGNLSGFNTMDDVDSCIFFSNIVDNAIEANILCNEERYINLIVTKAKKLIYIQFDNPYSEVVDETKREELKADGKIHGIGLGNISEIVSKYDGEKKIEKNDNKFSIKVCFTWG